MCRFFARVYFGPAIGMMFVEKDYKNNHETLAVTHELHEVTALGHVPFPRKRDTGVMFSVFNTRYGHLITTTFQTNGMA